jgi:SAM-dependent methyltransferase
VSRDDYGDVTARFYDRAYALLRDGSGDREFYLALAREARGPVLELGCGTGRVLLPIATTGIPCTGLDASPRMLAELRRKPFPPTLRLVCDDMKSFDLGPDRFGLIYSAFRAFQHLDAVEDQLACLACVRRHLAPGGCFAFDVFAPRLDRTAIVEEPEREDARFEQDGETIIRHTSVRRDLARQSMQVAMRYERRRDDEHVADHPVQFRMRYFFRYELEHLLHRAGFERVEIFGAFDRRPYDYFSGEQIVVAH